ncbi:MAG: DinB family protein [Acidimicrobiales bacterium]
MPIVPDTKDWTWVVERPCAECGFDASTFPREAVAQMVRDNAQQWQHLLAATGPARLTRRPSDDRWSALEYACHVRDVFRLYDYRLDLMLTEDDPAFPNWDQDVAAVEERYNDQDGAVVGRELVAAATALGAHFDTVQGEAWGRTGLRSDGAQFTVDTFARYMVHDPVHHLYDVEVGLSQV